MTYRPPKLEYIPRKTERWEMHLSFTVVPLPFDQVMPLAAGVARVRDGPMAADFGAIRPPMLWMEETQEAVGAKATCADDHYDAPVFPGILVWQAAEAPEMTVIEHPVDAVARADFTEDLARLIDNVEVIRFDSIFETQTRQYHGMTIRFGPNVRRRVGVSSGWHAEGVVWEDEGAPRDFEDPARYERRPKGRFDRTYVADCFAALGGDPETTLFGRRFSKSVHVWPLPYLSPDSAALECTAFDQSADAARRAGVTQHMPEPEESFAEDATLKRNLVRWGHTIDEARWKAYQSSLRAKTAKGREAAQWRVVDVLEQVHRELAEAGCHGRVARSVTYNPGLVSIMKHLGADTEAHARFRALHKKPGWFT